MDNRLFVTIRYTQCRGVVGEGKNRQVFKNPIVSSLLPIIFELDEDECQYIFVLASTTCYDFLRPLDFVFE